MVEGDTGYYTGLLIWAQNLRKKEKIFYSAIFLHHIKTGKKKFTGTKK